MKTILLILAFIGVVWSRPQNNPAQAVITKFENTINEVGSYFFNYETSNGQSQQERAEIKNPGTDQESIAVVGEYSYVGDDGKTYNVKYTADENGFQPEGEHIPPAADVKRPKTGIPSSAISSLAGGGLG